MTDINSTKHKHLTQDERLEIQDCLNRGMTFKSIASRIGKDQTTVSKEVKRHLSASAVSVQRTDQNSNLTMPEPCPILLKAPFICNPCKRRHAYCGFAKQLYSAKAAQDKYEALLTEAREGIPLNKEEFYEIDSIVSNGIKHGQHLYHIMKANNLSISKSTVYRHLKRGYLSVGSLDFPRVVKFKARQQRHADYVPKAAKAGRTYDDFLACIEESSITSWVEMDTVIGHMGGKAILTMDFTFCNFMLGFLLEDKTSLEVTEKLKGFKSRLVENGLCFSVIFPLILTDNGGEFANVTVIENNQAGEKETSLFFCDPYKSCQKPKVEKNHTLFRDIVPKGESFDSFSQQTVDMIFSHINSVKRKSLNGKTPFEMFSFAYGADTPAVLGISHIPPEKVVQSPKLLKQQPSDCDNT
jgi:IS30 family transposase